MLGTQHLTTFDNLLLCCGGVEAQNHVVAVRQMHHASQPETVIFYHGRKRQKNGQTGTSGKWKVGGEVEAFHRYLVLEIFGTLAVSQLAVGSLREMRS